MYLKRNRALRYKSLPLHRKEEASALLLLFSLDPSVLVAGNGSNEARRGWQNGQPIGKTMTLDKENHLESSKFCTVGGAFIISH